MSKKIAKKKVSKKVNAKKTTSKVTEIVNPKMLQMENKKIQVRIAKIKHKFDEIYVMVAPDQVGKVVELDEDLVKEIIKNHDEFLKAQAILSMA